MDTQRAGRPAAQMPSRLSDTGDACAVPDGRFLVRVCPDWTTLVADVIAEVQRCLPSDPLQSLTLVCRGSAAQRALSQAIARANGSEVDGGICAGVKFITMAGLRREVDAALLGLPDGGDPWRRRPLALIIVDLIRTHRDEPWCAPIARHVHPGVTIDALSRHDLEPGSADQLQPWRRPGRAYATADHIAQLFSSYLRDAPDLIRQWNSSPPEQAMGIGGLRLPDRYRWQPIIWQLCREALSPVPDPVSRRDQMLQSLQASVDVAAHRRGVPELPDRLLLVDPGPLSVADHELLAALSAPGSASSPDSAGVRPITLWQLQPPAPASPWARRLGAGARTGLDRLTTAGAVPVWVSPPPGLAQLSPSTHRPSPALGRPTTLNRLQSVLLMGESAPTPDAHALLSVDEIASRSADASRSQDQSVQVHASHGPDRQVEVLRDLLCALFVEDPTLEPRDVVVLCPQLARFAPTIRAAFATADIADGVHPSATPSERVHHPATALRVQVAGSALEEANPAIDLLASLLALPSSRATAQDFVDLCASPLIAERFQLEPDDLDVLADLLAAAYTRWGIDAGHRATFGVGAVRQSTWLASIERILVGLAIGGEPAGWLGHASPVDGVSSNHADVIGAAAEILSRVRRLMALWEASPATMSEWTSRLRDGLDSLSLSNGRHSAALASARARLRETDILTQNNSALLSTADVRGQFSTLVRHTHGRANHRNGSLLVTSLDDLQNVSYRTVVLLGIDDGVIPPPVAMPGDSLLDRVGDPESGSRARSLTAFAEAVRAAQDTLVVIHQGLDARTNEPVPTPTVVAELIEACRPLGGCLQQWHSLLAESMNNFFEFDDGDSMPEPPFSFDPVALRGARALEARTRGQQAPTPVRPHLEPAPADADLSELVAFLRNPAAALLRHRLGVSLASYQAELDPEIPVEADGLMRWQVGSDFLAAELAGNQLDDVERAVQLSGQLPPYPHASKAIQQERNKAVNLAAQVMQRLDLPGSRTPRASQLHRIHLDLSDQGAGLLTAQLRTIGVTVVKWRPGRLRFSHLFELWLELLILRAAQPETQWRGTYLGSGDEYTMIAPNGATARRFLAQLCRLRADGLSDVVPIPPQVVNQLISLDPGGAGPAARSSARQAWQQISKQPEWRICLPVDFQGLEKLAPLPGDPGEPRPRRLDQLTTWMSAPLLKAIGALPTDGSVR